MKFKYTFFTLFVFSIILINPILSFADDYNDNENISPDFLEVSSSSVSQDIPKINARHAVVLDRLSGTILYGKNENEQCKMASTTKILTAIVVIERSQDLSEIVSVSSKASHAGRLKIRLVH